MEKSEQKINCSVGILTCNSEKYLARALDSVSRFREVVIADGGSTDRTLEIAKKYGCRIISQSHPGTPIADFSVERNLTLDAATSDWFFYLDSDEVMSDALSAAIGDITRRTHHEYLVYRVRYEKTSPDVSVRYKTAKEYYQTRFFNKKSGARFVKPMHERIAIPDHVPVGLIEAPWYVPLDTQLDFKTYQRKIAYRIDIMAAHAQFRGIRHFLKLTYMIPILEILKSSIKIVYLFFDGSTHRIPTRYEVYRMYSQLYLMRAYTNAFFRRKNDVKHS